MYLKWKNRKSQKNCQNVSSLRKPLSADIVYLWWVISVVDECCDIPAASLVTEYRFIFLRFESSMDLIFRTIFDTTNSMRTAATRTRTRWRRILRRFKYSRLFTGPLLLYITAEVNLAHHCIVIVDSCAVLYYVVKLRTTQLAFVFRA